MLDPARPGLDRGDGAAPEGAPSPSATRSRPPGWRDPRLWIGVALVAVSVVAGARLIGAADDSVTVWAAATDLAPGHEVVAEDLVPVRVRFDSGTDLARYLPTEQQLPEGLVLQRALGQGELVPRAALGEDGQAGAVRLSVSIPGEQVPPALDVGSRVDVYVLPQSGRGDGTAERVLEGVAVVAAPAPSQQLGAVSTGRQLVLSVPEDQAEVVGDVLAATRDDRVRVVGLG